MSVVEGICSRLISAGADKIEIINCLMDLKDNIELLQAASEYSKFLSMFIPNALQLLKVVQPKFAENYSENTIRRLVLEILGNIPTNEILKPFLGDIYESLLMVLEQDNEENALISLRIIVDLLKNFRLFLENYIQSFINVVFKFYTNFNSAVENLIENPKPIEIPPALFSFRVLTECPIVIVLIFQLHRKFVNDNIPKFIPLIIQALSVRLSVHQAEAKRAMNEGYLYIETDPSLLKRHHFSDFVASQIKTLSFLAYILRGYAAILRPFQQQIPEFVIHLLRICPGEYYASRKELLVASRHIISSEFRDSFLPYIEYLLHERILIGYGITAFQSQRSLSFSLLADLVHHLRMQLPAPILARITAIYTRNLHEASLPITIQTMSAKLLLNLMDCVLSDNVPPEERRPILMIIFHSFVKKFQGIKNSSSSPPISENKEIDLTRLAFESYSESIKDNKILLKTLMAGMKSILFGIRTCSTPPGSFSPQQIIFTVRGFTADEVEALSDLFVSAIDCLSLNSGNGLKEKDKTSFQIPQDEKELMEQFASVFTVLDSAVFQDLVVSNFEFLFESICRANNLIAIPQYFLAISGVSNIFASLMLKFLMKNFSKIDGPDSAVMLRLFKLVFLSVTVYPDENESVLQPYISEIIIKCLKNPTKSSDPMNSFLLLRSLFRSIGGGRFELLYKEVLPLLPVLLDGLNNLLETAQTPTLKELFVELCLTTPVRLSVLLPYLSHLMKPLVLALQAGPELVSQGLRTLELCIDNLTQDFLDPLLLPVIEDLMNSLWNHIKPPPYNQNHAQTTVRILGKLSGRNRRFFREPTVISHNKSSSFISLAIQNPDGYDFKVPIDNLCELSLTILASTTESVSTKKHAFDLITSSLCSICNFAELNSISPDSIAAVLLSLSKRDVVNFIPKVSIDEVKEEKSTLDEIEKKLKKLGREYVKDGAGEHMIKVIVKSLFFAAAIDDLKEEAMSFLKVLYSHFALLKVLEMYDMKNDKDNKPEEAHLEENSRKVFDALVDCLVEVVAIDRMDYYVIVEEMVVFLYENCLKFCLSLSKLEQLPMFFLLSSKFCSLCYQKEFPKKRGGCFGISIIAGKLNFGVKWMLSQQLKYVRALLYILKDHSVGITACNIDNATKTLYLVLKLCNRMREDSDVDEKSKEIYFSQLSSLLVSELSNSNGVVRETIQSCLQLLADLIGSEVTEILMPVKEKFLIPIFSKPLRALPFQIQIGNIDAVSYCLSLRPPLLTFNDELVRLIQEAVAIADAEDHALISRPNTYNMSLITSLRVVCLKLLSTAMSCAEFHSQKQGAIRNKIVTIFFKSLYSKAEEIIEVSKEGLRQVMAHQNKLPRDLLQHGLRPVLMNLSEYKRLTLAGLEGLGRLLDLLNSYFKVEIGAKLLEHLRAWAEPVILEEAAVKPLMDSNEVKIIAALIDIFHLLPPKADIFISDLVDVVLGIEKMIRRCISSPFRKSLLKFLNKYSQNAIEYFLMKIDSPLHFSLFCYLLTLPDSIPLKTEVFNQSEKLVSTCLSSSEPEIVFRGLKLVKMLAKSKWTKDDDFLIQSIISIWNNLITVSAESLSFSISPPHLDLDHAINNCKDVVISISSCHSDSFLEPLKMCILHISDKSLCDFYDKIIENYSEAQTLNVASRAIDIFALDDNLRIKYGALKFIIAPAVRKLVAFHGTVDPSELIAKLINAIFAAPSLAFSSDFCSTLEFFYLEISQLLINLSQFAQTAPFSPKILEFCIRMGHIDEPVLKQSFYVVIGRYCQVFGVANNQVDQMKDMVLSILKVFNSESKTLGKKAMDLLLPCIKETMNGGDFIRFLKGIILKENHSINHLMIILSTIITNQDILVSFAQKLLPCLINSMVKIGCYSGSTAENKLVSVELLELIDKWNQGSIGDSYSEIIFNSQLRILSSFNEEIDEQSSNVATRCFKALTAMIKSGKITTRIIKYSLIEKVLSMNEQSEETLISCLNITKLLIILLAHKPPSGESISVAKIIELLITVDHAKLIKELAVVVEKTYSLGISDPDYQPFFQKMDSITVDCFQSFKNLQALGVLLNAEAKYNATVFDQSRLQPTMKILQKTIKDFISESTENLGNLVILLVSLLNVRIESLQDLRSTFIAALLALAEKSIENASNGNQFCEGVLKHLLKLATDWILQRDKSYPTIQEKLSFVVSMENLVSMPESPLYESYLILIIHIYNEPAFMKAEAVASAKLEKSFLIGMTQSKDTHLRDRFFFTFEKSLQKTSLFQRMKYVFSKQNWESLGSYFWIFQVIRIIMSAFPPNLLQISPKFRLLSNLKIPEHTYAGADSNLTLALQDHFACAKRTEGKAERFHKAIQELLLVDVAQSYRFWTLLFPFCVQMMERKEIAELGSIMTKFLSQAYHLQQQDCRPNCIEAIMEGISNVDISLNFQVPFQLVKYLGKTFNCWYSAIKILEDRLVEDCQVPLGNSTDEVNYEREAGLDGLAELYSLLKEDDFYFGLWRRRCLFPETNCALAFDQHGKWESAQIMYEAVQTKARNGLLPFSESEYLLWEGRWISCSEKLQQWDLLVEIAKIENDKDLNLECAWRLNDWSLPNELASIGNLLTISHPSSNSLPSFNHNLPEYSARRKLFEAYFNLLQIESKPELSAEYQKACEESLNLMIRKWNSFPLHVAKGNLEILHLFQHYVEVQEAQQIYSGISMSNRGQVVQELKGILSTWRDRLPNIWDEINVWSDLVSWRKHVFSSINHAFEASILEQQQAVQQAGSSSVTVSNSFAFRGFHETAWIINRFAHVARKHNLIEVCLSSLNKIYTLPNIEIQDAFLKLREQAKCHLSNNNELPNGLEVINATNLGYFGNAQKAEFFALKAIFLSKMGFVEEANKVFAQAVQIDLNLAKGWAAWGKYNDERFSATKDLSFVVNSINCYLQAASLNRNARARQYLARILWLLTFEDSQGTLSKSFDLYNSELPIWYWITFIPQLLVSLSRNEFKQAKFILIKIAKSFPQSLYFVLRTFNEDFKQQTKVKSEESELDTDSKMEEVKSLEESKNEVDDNGQEKQKDLEEIMIEDNTKKTFFEHTEDLLAILKTGYPLLALSMENMVEHIIQRLRSSPDEDLYRIIVTLLYESFQQSMLKLNVNLADSYNGNLMEMSLMKVHDMISSPSHFNHKYKDEFERDFITCKPSLAEILVKLRHWRDRLEIVIKRIPKIVYLENFSRYLIEFEHQKYEDIEIPGQYLFLKDGNSDFVKIERFEPQVEIVRKHGTSYRRIFIRANDGSCHPFIIQNPGARHARREERILQICRLFNSVLDKRMQTRKRELSFNVPIIVPLSSHVRMIQDDPSAVSLEDMYDDYCSKVNLPSDNVFIYFRDKMQKALFENSIPLKKGNTDVLNLRIELFEEISTKLIPDNIAYNYLLDNLTAFQDLFLFRKRCSSQLAALSFITYVLGIGHRFPHKIFFSRKFGNVMSTDMLPILNQLGQFTLTEAVPFRLTPNLQKLMGPVGMEGVFTTAIFAIGNALVNPELAMEDVVSLFVRDELQSWQNSIANRSSPSNSDGSDKDDEQMSKIAQNVELIHKRAQTLACLKDQEKSLETNVPIIQTILDLMSCAVNPQKLAQMDPHWHPWL